MREESKIILCFSACQGLMTAKPYILNQIINQFVTKTTTLFLFILKIVILLNKASGKTST